MLKQEEITLENLRKTIFPQGYSGFYDWLFEEVKEHIEKTCEKYLKEEKIVIYCFYCLSEMHLVFCYNHFKAYEDNSNLVAQFEKEYQAIINENYKLITKFRRDKNKIAEYYISPRIQKSKYATDLFTYDKLIATNLYRDEAIMLSLELQRNKIYHSLTKTPDQSGKYEIYCYSKKALKNKNDLLSFAIGEFISKIIGKEIEWEIGKIVELNISRDDILYKITSKPSNQYINKTIDMLVVYIRRILR